MVKVAYPAGVDRDVLGPGLCALKIARHAPCTRCPCPGLHPNSDTKVVSDQGDDDDDDDEPLDNYMDSCECGHDVKTHNANEAELGRIEFNRRANVAIRIDELLHVRTYS